MRKTWNWKFAIKAVGSSIVGLVAMLMLVEIWGAWTGPENYPGELPAVVLRTPAWLLTCNLGVAGNEPQHLAALAGRDAGASPLGMDGTRWFSTRPLNVR